jgi:hypothetical protein
VRVNIYAEELTDKVEAIRKPIGDQTFTGIRLFLELPVTVNGEQVSGPFMHRPGDDDSAAITLWDVGDCEKLRRALKAMLAALDPSN